jgi:hypothetical protein
MVALNHTSSVHRYTGGLNYHCYLSVDRLLYNSLKLQRHKTDDVTTPKALVGAGFTVRTAARTTASKEVSRGYPLTSAILCEGLQNRDRVRAASLFSRLLPPPP